MLNILVIGLGLILPAFLVTRRFTKVSRLKKRMPLELQGLIVKRPKYYLSNLGSMMLSGLFLGFRHFNNDALSIMVGSALILFLVVAYINGACLWNPRGIYNLFTGRELTALERIKREFKKKTITKQGEKVGINSIFINRRASDIQTGAYAIDGMGINEFSLHSVSEMEFKQALFLKKQLMVFLSFQDARFSSYVTAEQLHAQRMLGAEICKGYKAMRQAAGTIEKPVLEKMSSVMKKKRLDPVLEEINSLLESKQISKEKELKLIELKGDIMEKFEESKKNRDEEADQILVAGAKFHQLNKKYL